MGSFISEGESEVMNLKEDMGRQLVKKFIEEMKAIGIDKDEAIEIIKREE